MKILVMFLGLLLKICNSLNGTVDMRAENIGESEKLMFKVSGLDVTHICWIGP